MIVHMDGAMVAISVKEVTCKKHSGLHSKASLPLENTILIKGKLVSSAIRRETRFSQLKRMAFNGKV